MNHKLSIFAFIFGCAFVSLHAQASEQAGGTKQGRSPFQVDNIPPVKAMNAPVTPKMNLNSRSMAAPMVNLTLNQDMLLSQELKKWAISNGFKPLWNSTRDYMIYNTINITGKSTDDALTQLGQIFTSEHYGLVIKLYEKNNVLVIDAQ
ncbi:TcpQ domain-containing protein [Citrobacter arsenatis]|uniref:TcpQ domain-containing protein n=1 Tax=Citrobacter arsenatis TaxID=2546350 RepID=UPI003D7FD044